MAQHCRTCAHAQRPEIERLKDGGATLQALSDAFGLTKATLNRHFVNRHHLCRFEAQECSPEAAQAAATATAGGDAPGRSPPVLGPAPRRRAIGGGPRPVQPVAPQDECPGAQVVAFVRPAPVAIEEPRPEPVPLLKQIADLLELGYTHDDVGYQLSIGGDEMAGYIAAIEDAKRTLLSKSAEDWGASLVYSCMSRLARYRRRQTELEAALKHREADRMDDKIVAAERELRKLLTDFGLVGRLDRSALEQQAGGLDDIFSAVKNSINGVFVEPKTPADRKQLRLG